MSDSIKSEQLHFITSEPQEFYGGAKFQMAKAFCIAAHEAVGQKRKYTNEPYYVHPINVGKILINHMQLGNTGFLANDTLLIAALLHDVVEDTKVSFEIIEELFGEWVRLLVYWLTDTSTPEDGNRAARKAIDRKVLAGAPGPAQTIKYADLIDNTESIVEHDPGFARVYLREKMELLNVMDKGDQALREQAYFLCKSGMDLLGMKR